MKAGPTLLEAPKSAALSLEGSYWLKALGLSGLGARIFRKRCTAPSASALSGGRGCKADFLLWAGLSGWGRTTNTAPFLAHSMFGRRGMAVLKRVCGTTAWQILDFYHNQIAPAAIIGGHFDLKSLRALGSFR